MKGAISLALMAVASMGASAAFVDQCSALTSINVGSGCSAGTVASGSPLEVDIPITLEQAAKPIYIAVWNTGASTTFDADITVSMTGPDATTYTEGASFVRKQVGTLDWGYTLELAANAACAGTFKLSIANGQSNAVGVGVFVRIGDRGLTQTFRPRQETFSRTPMMTEFEVTPFDSWTANIEDSVISTPQIMKQINFMIANGASFNAQGNYALRQAGNVALAAVTTATNTSGTTAMANYTDINRHNGAIMLAYTPPGTPPAYSVDEIGPYVTVRVSTSEFMQYPLMTGPMDITVPVGGTSDVYRVALTSTWHKLMPQYGNGATNLSTYAVMNPVTKAAVGQAGNKVNDANGMVNNAVTGLLNTFLANPQTNNLNQLQRLAPVPANAASAMVFVTFGAGCSATAGQAIIGSAQLNVMNIPGECQSYRDCDKSGSDHPSLSYRLSANDDEERLRHCVVAPSLDNPLMPYTRCMECLADCDCESGQYCHKDAGVCNTVNGVYTCDRGSAQKLGLCRKKDINKEILGKACRSGAGATLAQSSAFAVAASPSTPQLLVSEGPNYNGDETSATADKFCGEVLFYNASSGVAGVRGSEARSILWEGYCFNGECQECAPDTMDTCQGRRSCINGQQMETIDVDGTIRTFTSNTVAGTLLAGVMMIILVQALVVCRICQARKYHRAGEAKQAAEDDAESIKA